MPVLWKTPFQIRGVNLNTISSHWRWWELHKDIIEETAIIFSGYLLSLILDCARPQWLGGVADMSQFYLDFRNQLETV